MFLSFILLLPLYSYISPFSIPLIVTYYLLLLFYLSFSSSASLYPPTFHSSLPRLLFFLFNLIFVYSLLLLSFNLFIFSVFFLCYSFHILYSYSYFPPFSPPAFPFSITLLPTELCAQGLDGKKDRFIFVGVSETRWTRKCLLAALQAGDCCQVLG